MAGVGTVVVVPARDEEQRIGACLQALADQSVGSDAFEVVVVLDACVDRTAQAVAQAAGALGLALTSIPGPGFGSGPARMVGMDLACERLLAAGRRDGLIACTDADSRPDPDWLERQLAHVAAGARAIAGLIELDDDEAAQLPAGVRRRRDRDVAARLAQVRRIEPGAGHHHLAGASLGVTAAVYREVGGIEPLAALEDVGFAARLAEHHVPVLRASDVKVRTSARADGRAGRGLSVDLAVSRWYERRRHRAAEFSPRGLRAVKGRSVGDGDRAGQGVRGDDRRRAQRRPWPRWGATGLVDELVVVDAASRDGSARIAAAHGARVVQQDEVAAELGPALGKGDAMWRALQVTGGDVVCFLDGDTRDPTAPRTCSGCSGRCCATPRWHSSRARFTVRWTPARRRWPTRAVVSPSSWRGR